MRTMEGLPTKKQLKQVRTDSGITLIALVITIILLVILAGVSIAVITGDNGILSEARKAQTLTVQAEEKEQIILAYNAAVTTKYADATYKASVGISTTELTEQLVTRQKAKATVTDGDDTTTIKVTFTDSNNVYTVNKTQGTVTLIEPTV